MLPSMSPRLILLRHAEAAAPGAGGERELTPHGRAQAVAAGRALGALLPAGTILHGPLVRCVQTARLVADGSGWATEPSVRTELNEDASLASLLDLVRASSPGTVLVGHQPCLAALVDVLLRGPGHDSAALPAAFDFRPAMLVGLDSAAGPDGRWALALLLPSDTLQAVLGPR